MARICSNCGKEIPEGAAFCTECGTPAPAGGTGIAPQGPLIKDSAPQQSVYEAILRVRLEEVKRRLRYTKASIAEITAACGWANPIPPKILFKRRFGLSMRDYRNQANAV